MVADRSRLQTTGSNIYHNKLSNRTNHRYCPHSFYQILSFATNIKKNKHPIIV